MTDTTRTGPLDPFIDRFRYLFALTLLAARSRWCCSASKLMIQMMQVLYFIFAFCCNIGWMMTYIQLRFTSLGLAYYYDDM